MLLALRVTVPVPSLVRPPVPLITVVLTVVLPAPPTVNRKPPLVMPPDTVSVPASAFTRAALPNVIAPDHVFVLATWRSAPPPAMPVPFSVTGSATTSPLPSSCSAAPPATVVAPAVAPRAVLFCTSSTPALTVVAPLYVLAPDNVSVPVPVLVSATVPLPF